MNISELRDFLIPLLKNHAEVPVIEADQGGEIPDGEHAVYKFIAPYVKEVGMPNVRYSGSASFLKQHHDEDYRATISITAISDENDNSLELAMSMREWFTFYGVDRLQTAGITAVTIGDIGNRDSVNDDETRQGFDVSLRIPRELSREVDYFNRVDIKRA
jgi:hypothetical protein